MPSPDPDSQPKVSTLPLTKKRRTSVSERPPEAESTSGRCLFPTLPLELLAEILIQTNSPRDVLSVARTSKFICSTLVCNPAANFIWRTVRKKCLPHALPDPTPNFTEAAYAAFVYDGGLCESRCRKDIVERYLIDVVSMFQGRARDEIWIPYVESTRCFGTKLQFPTIHHDFPASTPDNAWPETPTVLMKKSEWERFRAEYAAFSALSPPPSEELRKACADQIAKFPKVMGLAVALQKWKCSYDRMHRTIRAKNEEVAKSRALLEGWDVHDLLNCQSYGSLHRRKTYMLEEVTPRDFLSIKPLVEAQLVKMQVHRQNKQNEASYRQRRNDVEQYYNRLRSAGTVVPSLYEFRKFPVMKTMQGSVTGSRPNSEGLAEDMKNSALVAELVTADLKSWMEPAREKLSELLGFPRWRSASKTKLHPLDRITARFRCQRCGKVAKTKDKKPVDWSVDRFVKDEKASDAVARLLTLVGVTDEDAEARDTVKTLGARIQCLSCEHAFIVMDFPTLVGHAHRHDDMQVAILSEGEVPEHAFESGLSAKLLDKGFRPQKLRSEANYRCRHCAPVCKSAGASVDGGGQVSAGEPAAKETPTGDPKKRQRNRKSPLRLMDFNALRSHLKERHRIEMVSDEDFFAQTPVKWQT
ncbi:uncharacterized protein EDB91DRAFT_1131442 [Suillus paluster]|uniref:uncharacterized protein n=1 Tax=Suillus paluster TaxID=48578 RepID=UPI001B8738EC|nr:uncharacterized protein EDB91DRAFT_1131442 [Suillus paluster]KAG1740787.1 hypothetical protein EDB91DRAFT_1131442 [Suillus paluster]